MGCHASKTELRNKKIQQIKKHNLKKQQEKKQDQHHDFKDNLPTAQNSPPIQPYQNEVLLEFKNTISLYLDLNDNIQRDQLIQIAEIIPKYTITIDFVNTRKQLRTQETEPVPVISKDCCESFIFTKRRLHNKMKKLEGMAQQLEQDKLQKIDPRLKKIYLLK